jgi:hypothetical protein
MRRRKPPELGTQQREFTLFTNTGRISPVDQTSRLYKAEQLWRQTNPDAGKSISVEGARDLIGETLHHRVMNDIPGIEQVRAEFDPDKIGIHVAGGRVRLGKGLIAGTSEEGHVVFKKDLPITVGAVTHEASHLLHRLGHQFDSVGLNEKGEAGFRHQWPFSSTHIVAAHNQVSRSSARELGAIYDAYGVRYKP